MIARILQVWRSLRPRQSPPHLTPTRFSSPTAANPSSPPRRRIRPSMEEEGEGEPRDWAEMPSDALSAVFGKLDMSDLFTGAGLVCSAWRRLAAHDNTLWRRVDMTHHGDLMETEEAEAMARAAVDRAAGTLDAFWADTFVTDGLLRYISERALLLKSLQLCLCDKVSNEGLADAVKGFPQLEELDITFCSVYGDVCESVGKACPQLKCFRLNERWNDVGRGLAAFEESMDDDTEALGIANNMPELRDLQLIGNNLTNDGLMAILVHCPHLESLDIRQCFNLRIDDAMKSRCARIANLKLPHDPITDFKYRAYIASTGDDYGSDFEVDMYYDQLELETDDEYVEFDDMDAFDEADSDSSMYDGIFDA